MFKSIMVTTDLSEASDHVIGCLAAFRALGVERVILLHCLGIRHIQDIKQVLTHIVEPKLNEQVAALEKQGYVASLEIAPGLPQFEINRIAEEKGCSLIVVGTHGQTMSSEILLGSVASEVIHSTHKPVLLIRLKITEAKDRVSCESACANMMEHVLFPTDFSDNAEHAFAYVNELAKTVAKRITLLHVQDKVRIDKHLEYKLEEFNSIDETRLDRMKTSLAQSSGAYVETATVYGMPVSEILKKAQENKVTLIVMGSQGRGYISEFFLGSVSHNIARHSETSVLLIPALRTGH